MLILAETTAGLPTDWVSLIQTVGVPLALVIFFVYQSKLREDRLSDRIEKLEDYQRNKLEAVVAENTRVMSRLEQLFDRDERIRA